MAKKKSRPSPMVWFLLLVGIDAWLVALFLGGWMVLMAVGVFEMIPDVVVGIAGAGIIGGFFYGLGMIMWELEN